MIRKAPKRIYAALLLLILVAAYAGHKVHIYKEDPAHFAALCGDLMPDNGAHQIVVERCIVDDFYFFPYLDATSALPANIRARSRRKRALLTPARWAF